MNVLILSQYFWPENFRINELTTELSKIKKLKIHVLTGLPSYPKKNFFKNKKIKKFKNLNINRVPVYLRDGTMFSKYLNYISFVISASFYLLFKNKIKFDKIFIFQVSPVFSAIPAIIYSKIVKCKIYLWVLDLWPESIKVFGFNSRILFFFIKKISDLIYSRADVLLAQSNSIKKILKRRYKKKTYYFPNWSEEVKVVRVNNVLEKKIKQKDVKKRINIFFGGNLGKAQDIENILKIIQKTNKLEKYNWFFFGEGSEKDKIQYFINKSRRKNNIFLFSTLPQSQFKYLVKKYADLMLVSLANYQTLKWTVPGKIQFYFQCKKPIIGALSGEANSLIKKSNSGFVVNSGDYLSFSKLLTNLSKSHKKSIFKDKGINGYNFSKKNFNKKKIIKELKDILLTLK